MTTAGLIEWQRSQGRRVERLPAGILLTHQESLFAAFRGRLRRPSRGLLANTIVLGRDGRRMAAAGGFGVGGPATAMALEELAALGATDVIAVDVAASLTADLASGTALLPAAARWDGGTPSHYAAGVGEAEADGDVRERLGAELSAQGLSAVDGRVWSTDAPFRETATEIDVFRAAGAVAVDMETATLFAVAKALGLRAAAVLVIGDTLLDEWRPPPEAATVSKMLRRVADVALSCLPA